MKSPLADGGQFALWSAEPTRLDGLGPYPVVRDNVNGQLAAQHPFRSLCE